MYSADRQVLEAACRWASEGRRFTLATVARTWGSAPRPVGSMMALRDDGQVQGSVSGGCIEQDLIDRVLNGSLENGGGDSASPFVLKYGVTKEEAQRFGLPCGGTMELVIESAPESTALQEIAVRIARGELVRRSVTVGKAGCVVDAGSAADTVNWDGQVLTTVHGPSWRLLIIGAGQISTYLAPMAQALDYQVFVCDPRSEYSEQWNIPGTTLLSSMPDDAVTELNLDPHSALVALTHDPKLDDMALLEALKSPAFYVGALGSASNNRKRRERLLQYFDLTKEEVERLHGPVGLRIGSRTPPEIAVAILAEMTAVKNGVWTKEGLQPKQSTTVGCSVS